MQPTPLCRSKNWRMLQIRIVSASNVFMLSPLTPLPHFYASLLWNYVWLFWSWGKRFPTMKNERMEYWWTRKRITLLSSRIEARVCWCEFSWLRRSNAITYLICRKVVFEIVGHQIGTSYHADRREVKWQIPKICYTYSIIDLKEGTGVWSTFSLPVFLFSSLKIAWFIHSI